MPAPPRPTLFPYTTLFRSGQRRGPWRVVWGALTPFFEPPAPVPSLGQRARLARGLGETRIASGGAHVGIPGARAARGRTAPAIRLIRVIESSPIVPSPEAG